MKRTPLIAAILMSLVLSSAATAETRSLAVSSADVIVSPEGEGRILLKFPSLRGLENVALGEARLELPIPMVAPEDGLEMRVHPLTRNWTAGSVSWTSGWARPGGDFVDEVYGRSEFRTGGGRTTSDIDVTTILLEMLSGQEDYGFILTVPSHRGEGFDETNRGRLEEAVQGAVLDIRYRNRVTPPVSRRG